MHTFVQENAAVVILICIAVLILIVVWLSNTYINVKRMNTRFHDLKMRVKELSQNPMRKHYKKLKEIDDDDVRSWLKEDVTPRYKTCVEDIHACREMRSHIEKLAGEMEYKKAMPEMDALEEKIDQTAKRIRIVNSSLDSTEQKYEKKKAQKPMFEPEVTQEMVEQRPKLSRRARRAKYYE
ncbi:septation ring formation regulator EzrA [Catenisphaera adipataccumulans]|jgi:septation ring formation regulator|uniref:Septation ring formation regulator EzrA n=1 Tax=Catenisphaera adipataccumulans TaxID=700500 RepID=A0A7W8D0B0_9FIRM|nr:septation ring formation regulator EzrA [Catenisphaera adipataccumulans]MBB5183753.1 septation ring formation regulator EzrA [Catenisphaera adipataccumulans]